jgi:hypothetical protein
VVAVSKPPQNTILLRINANLLGSPLPFASSWLHHTMGGKVSTWERVDKSLALFPFREKIRCRATGGSSMPSKLTDAQREWLTGLRDDPEYDRKHRPHAATETSCKRRGWAVYRRLSGTKRGWRITLSGRLVLENVVC